MRVESECPFSVFFKKGKHNVSGGGGMFVSEGEYRSNCKGYDMY